MIEVMSPGSITADRTGKPAEYARAGIPHFWRVENETDDVRGLTVFRYRLDPTTGVYTSSGAHKGKLAVSDPFDFAMDLADLL
ncbi:MAG: hypothetical protein QOI78_2668 [Actinomycetota bacterium]|nr:hypothetical protein [Actinomycetota bacterium]